jgi:hypothetical protein
MSGGRDRVARLWRLAWGVSRRSAPKTPSVALAVIVGMMAAVTVLRWFVDRAGQAAALLYVVPIALSALRFGRRGGVAAAGSGIAAFVVLEVIRSRGDVGLTGWVAPLLAMALMGGLVGYLSESAARHEAAQRLQARRLDELGAAQRAASEATDSIVQQVVAARWMLEAGKNQEALEALNATVDDGITQVSGTLTPLSPEATRDGRPSVARNTVRRWSARTRPRDHRLTPG